MTQLKARLRFLIVARKKFRSRPSRPSCESKGLRAGSVGISWSASAGRPILYPSAQALYLEAPTDFEDPGFARLPRFKCS
jgi:hypothetical protein